MTDNNIKLEIPADTHGVELQNLMYQFVSWYSRVLDQLENAQTLYDKYKLFVEFVESEAIVAVNRDCNEEGLKLSAEIKRAIAMNKSVDVEGRVTTLYEERKKLIEYDHKLRNLKAAARKLDRLVSACQTGLGFDKREMEMMKKGSY